MSHLKGSVKKDDKWELDISTEEARAKNQEAIDVCPVQIISMKKLKD